MARPVIPPGSAPSTLYVSDSARPPRAVPGRRFPRLAAPRVLAVPAGAALVLVGLFAVPRTPLLLAGALVAALLIIAGRQILADLIAGVVLRRTRTVRLGDRVRLYPGRLDTTFEGTVTAIGPGRLRLRSAGATLAIPHTQVLGAAVAVLDPEAGPPAPVSRASRRRPYRSMRHPEILRTARVIGGRRPADARRRWRSGHDLRRDSDAHALHADLGGVERLVEQQGVVVGQGEGQLGGVHPHQA